MAASETSICNLALGRLGNDSILSTDDDSESARVCKLFYGQTRDEVLRSHRWKFATVLASLAQLTATPVFDWSYQYQLPTDCLRVLQVNGFEPWEQPGLFEIQGRFLLTDADGANVKYTSRITDANQFDPLFIEALACKLASKIAAGLTDSQSRVQALLTEYKTLTGAEAMRVDAMEGRPKRKLPYVQSDLVNSRRGSSLG
ncbi:MAG: hypothetical protein ABIP97_12475 [Chthoniobacterales bacterium]